MHIFVFVAFLAVFPHIAIASTDVESSKVSIDLPEGVWPCFPNEYRKQERNIPLIRSLDSQNAVIQISKDSTAELIDPDYAEHCELHYAAAFETGLTHKESETLAGAYSVSVKVPVYLEFSSLLISRGEIIDASYLVLLAAIHLLQNEEACTFLENDMVNRSFYCDTGRGLELHAQVENSFWSLTRAASNRNDLSNDALSAFTSQITEVLNATSD